MTSAPAAITGSPPRAWGKAGSSRGVHLCLRFTPTCVGKRSSPGQGVVQSPVHPHVRGEKNRATSSGCSPGGSPPRAWGKDRVGLRARGSDRFTPTCVGKSRRGKRSWGTPPVHPHVRGEKSAHHHGPPRGMLVHPHVRGEKGVWSPSMSESRGSPPRAWGKVLPLRAPRKLFRFTPTCVGKRFRPRGGYARARVHPHVRGEKRRWDHRRNRESGSPPRAWGKEARGNRIESRKRFTPTCVGKRQRAPSSVT